MIPIAPKFAACLRMYYSITGGKAHPNAPHWNGRVNIYKIYDENGEKYEMIYIDTITLFCFQIERLTYMTNLCK